MERGIAQDMKRRGKGDGGNKRSAGDKLSEGRKRQLKYEHYIYVLSPCIHCTFRDSTPHIGRQTAGPPIKSPHFHTKTDKLQFPEPWTLFEIPNIGQVQRPNIHENKKCCCLCEKVGALPSNAERGFIWHCLRSFYLEFQQWLYSAMSNVALSRITTVALCSNV